MAERYPRWQKKTIKQLMSERRVLLLSGPRQSGKTTLARELESDQTEYRTLDDSTLREAAENDPQSKVTSMHWRHSIWWSVYTLGRKLTMPASANKAGSLWSIVV